MKTNLCIAFILLLSLSGCDKRCKNFCGTWETANYDAYIRIKRDGDAFLLSVKNKNGEQDWLADKEYVMYYDYGVLRSEHTGFKTIVYDSIHQTILINEEKDEWSKVANKSEI